MLKITLSVKSGTDGFVDANPKFGLTHNPERAYLFQQGLLLRLMGESVSQVHFKDFENVFSTKPIKNGDMRSTTLSNEQREECDIEFKNELLELAKFTAKLETKHTVIRETESYNRMAFEQVAKFGRIYFPTFNGSELDSKERLNSKYAKYSTELGIFDVFSVANPLDLLVGDITSTNNAFCEIFKTLIDGNSYEDFKGKGFIKIEVAEEVAGKLSKLFVSDLSNITKTSSVNTFENIRSFVERNAFYFKGKNFIGHTYKKTELDEDDLATIHDFETQSQMLRIILAYYMKEYFSVYRDLTSVAKCKTFNNASVFGLANLAFKKKDILAAMLDWYTDPMKCPKEISRDLTSYDEFTSSTLNDSGYKVCSRSPVTSIKYDGSVELFVKCDSVETESFIKGRIANSNVWNIRVGKQCVGNLVSCNSLPDYIFDEINKVEELV